MGGASAAFVTIRFNAGGGVKAGVAIRFIATTELKGFSGAAQTELLMAAESAGVVALAATAAMAATAAGSTFTGRVAAHAKGRLAATKLAVPNITQPRATRGGGALRREFAYDFVGSTLAVAAACVACVAWGPALSPR